MCAADSLNMSRSPNAMRKTANDNMSLFKGTNARPVFNGEFKSSMDSYVLRTLTYHSATTWLRGTTKDGDHTWLQTRNDNYCWKFNFNCSRNQNFYAKCENIQAIKQKNHNNHNPRKREGERRRLPDSLFIGEQSRVSAIRENEPLPRLEQSPCTGSTGLKAWGLSQEHIESQ